MHERTDICAEDAARQISNFKWWNEDNYVHRMREDLVRLALPDRQTDRQTDSAIF